MPVELTTSAMRTETIRFWPVATVAMGEGYRGEPLFPKPNYPPA